MLTIAVLIFAVGAVGGLVLANSVLRGRLASWALSLLHMALGATGLVLTAIVVLGGTNDVSSIVPIALLILVVAALAGFYLASIHARKVSAPRGAVLAHAGIAVVGFLLLVGGAFRFI
jgi:FtsH-binding integral membrane protein